MRELSVNNKRIAKNALYMYIRMFITMLIGLYTSRVILASLGFNDYGLYNVVGGIIAMFSFVNGALANTTSRYITFYLGKDNVTCLRRVFSTAFFIHLVFALIIVALGETAGLWYVNNKLVIQEGRFDAAMWVYQFTVFTASVNIISVPFNAAIIAYEKMSTFAIIAIINSILKLVVAISLNYVSTDKLILYGFLLLLIQLLNNIIYWIYSTRKFEGIRIKCVFDRKMFKEMFGFTGWNLFGNFSYVFFNQGVNLILNFFCGTSVNAARGIAVQVDGIVRQFASNVQTAINPQIIKTYAQNEKQRMFSLIFTSSRYCFFLLYFIILPIILEAHYLLGLWLVDYPEHTASFLQITLMTVLLETLVTPMFMANLASGKVKVYQIVLSIISMVFIVVTFLAIKITKIPEIVFICILVMTIVEIIARIFIVHYQVGLPRKMYIKNVILKILLVGIISSIVPLLIRFLLPYGFVRLTIVSFVSVISIGITVYLLGINNEERLFLNNLLKKRIRLIIR